MPTIEYFIDDEPQITDDRVMTPTQILAKANLDPASHYLVRLDGASKHSYEGKPSEQIHMHPKIRFISVFTGAAPLS
jgi:hypothetical protein